MKEARILLLNYSLVLWAFGVFSGLACHFSEHGFSSGVSESDKIHFYIAGAVIGILALAFFLSILHELNVTNEKAGKK